MYLRTQFVTHHAFVQFAFFFFLFAKKRREAETWCIKKIPNQKVQRRRKKAQTVEQLIICCNKEIVCVYDRKLRFFAHSIASHFNFVFDDFVDYNRTNTQHRPPLMDTLIIFRLSLSSPRFVFRRSKKKWVELLSEIRKSIGTHFKIAFRIEFRHLDIMMFVQPFIIAFYFVSQKKISKETEKNIFFALCKALIMVKWKIFKCKWHSFETTTNGIVVGSQLPTNGFCVIFVKVLREIRTHFGHAFWCVWLRA